jgi:hypothetical protein
VTFMVIVKSPSSDQDSSTMRYKPFGRVQLVTG